MFQFESLDGAVVEVEVCCPYCGEMVSLSADPTGGSRQSYVEDCYVCCRPWQVTVFVDVNGVADVNVQRAD